jgi:hypothetical protein
VFTIDTREGLRSELIKAASSDPRISGVALTGSASVGKEDRWSDIDLAFGVHAELAQVLGEFTDRMYDRHEAIHHMDVQSGSWIYRVFLLADTLQVDLAFAPQSDFGAHGPTFKLISGTAIPDRPVPVGSARDLIDWAWLYALHARSSIARGKAWQAEYMISGMRDRVLALACLRHKLPAVEGRGMDQLPSDVTRPLEAALVRSLGADDLVSAFRATTEGLLAEIKEVDPLLAQRLRDVLLNLTALAGSRKLSE